MSHYDSSVQESLRYDATRQHWSAHIGSTYIQVPNAVYERLLTAYLQSHGITRKTRLQIFSEAESTWLKQANLEMEFRKDLQLFLFSNIPGVFVHIGTSSVLDTAQKA